MPQVIEVKKAAKPQSNCGACNKEIPKGAPYKWIKKRYDSKKVRCLDCGFRPSDHTGGRLGQVYAAQETACDALEGWDGDDISDLETTLEELEGELETLAEEYEESCENIREHFENSEKADECEEKAEQLREWQSDIESARGDLEAFEPEEDDEPPCPECNEPSEEFVNADNKEAFRCSNKDCEHEFTRDDVISDESEAQNANGQTRDDWAEEQRSRAQDAANECPL
jgi:DNA repair exonuclease SbcCD ATPase subunit